METKNQFIARASQIGKLMTNDRSGKQMGATAMTALKEIVIFDKYGFRKDITNKYLEKGIQNEKTSIKLASKVLNWFDVDAETEQQRLVNDFITGKPDINTKAVLADVKSSWNALTFPMFYEDDEENDIPNQDYFYQMQSYCWLTNKSQCELVYCLTDSPEQMILDEVNRAVWKNLPNPMFQDNTQSEIEDHFDLVIRQQMTFGNVPDEKRVKRFIIKADEAVIDKMKTRIEQCREIYSSLYSKI
jgi:hypothetical protein